MLSMRSGSSRSAAARGRRKQVLPTNQALERAGALRANRAVAVEPERGERGVGRRARSGPGRDQSVASAASTGEPGVVLGVTNRHGEAGDASTLRKIVRRRTYVRTVQRMAGTSLMEGVLIDWVATQSQPGPRLPVFSLSDEEVTAELARIQRDRARETAREAELILRLAELRPDTDDPQPGTPGARRRSWRKTDPEFAGVSEFFPDEVAH